MHRTALVALWSLSLSGLLPAQAGSLDPAFGAGGVVTGSSADAFRKVLVQPDGRILVAGWRTLANGDCTWLVQRYLAAGGIDASFAGTGTALAFGADPGDRAFDLTLDATGRILVVGQSRHVVASRVHGDLTVVRLLADGTADATFGSQGVVRVHASYGSRDDSSASSVAVQADGRIVVGGYATGRKTGIDLCLVRLLATGALDGSFGAAGVVLDALGTGTSLDWPAERCLCIQNDGRILFAGSAYWGTTNWSGNAWNLMRYLPDGSRDASWGSGGRVVAGFPGFTQAWLKGLGIDGNGNVVAGGRALHTIGSSGYDFFVARYLANGVLDGTLAGTGFTSSDLAGDDQGQGLALGAGGAIVQCGPAANSGVAMRHLADGSLDAGFGFGGVSQPAPLSGAFPRAVTVDAAGRVLVVMDTQGGSVLVRYLGS